MTGELEEAPGVVSAMRKGLKVARRLGVIMAASGVILSGAILILERYEAIPLALAMITGGPSLIALALGAKAWQAQAESRGGNP